MKTASILIELVVRMALFAAILTMVALQAREPRRLARVKLRPRP